MSAMVFLWLAISIAAILGCILVLKLNPTIALVIGSLIMGVGSGLGASATLSSITSGFGGTLGGIGTQVGHHLPFAADDGQLLEDHVREDQRRRHHLAGLVAGIAEHDALIARALLVLLGAHDALINVRRLFVDGRQDAARVAVELVFALGIADAVDHAARHALYIDIRFGAHLARHNHQSRGAKRLAGDFRVGVTTQEFVENGVRNLI